MLPFRQCVWFLVVLVIESYACKKINDKPLARYIIACHTTDFECFQQQYRALRDHFLLGNERYRIPTYENYVFEYGGGTCIKLAGLEGSELTSITMNSTARSYTLVIDFPLRILQVKNNVKVCAKPQQEVTVFKLHKNRLMRFTGNGSMVITYPYKLKLQSRVTYMYLEDENIDVTLDIPDLGHFHMKSQVEAMLYQWSEWAYEVVQHVDVAENFALPYTSQLGTLMEQLPLQKFILLYPDEEYYDLHFSWKEHKD